MSKQEEFEGAAAPSEGRGFLKGAGPTVAGGAIIEVGCSR